MLLSKFYVREFCQCPFGRILQKLRDHHGIDVPINSAQAITQGHAAQVLQIELEKLETDIPNESGVACLIVEMDGRMMPTITTKTGEVEGVAIDRRTTRKIGWQEAQLGLSRTPDQAIPTFGATFGTADEARAQLLGNDVGT